MRAIKRVKLTERHLIPGRATHTLFDSAGGRPFLPFQSLAITKIEEQSGYFLMYICDDGSGTDGWHQTLEGALHQAEWEFEVQPQEWIDVDEPF